MAKVVVFEEKHGSRYFILKDDSADSMARIAYTVLKERAEAGYWYPKLESIQRWKTAAIEDAKKDVEKKYGEFLALTEEEIAALPPALKTLAVEGREKAARRIARAETAYEWEEQFVTDLERLLALPMEEAIKLTNDTGRWRLATVLLESRSDSQYEGYSVERAKEV